MQAKQKRMGRPPTGRDPILTTRVPADTIAMIDFMAKHANSTRSTMARMVLMHGLYQILRGMPEDMSPEDAIKGLMKFLTKHNKDFAKAARER